MKAIISFVVSVIILGAIGFAVYYFLGAHTAFSVLFVFNILWLLGQKLHTDRKLNHLEMNIDTVISLLTKKG